MGRSFATVTELPAGRRSWCGLLCAPASLGSGVPQHCVVARRLRFHGNAPRTATRRLDTPAAAVRRSFALHPLGDWTRDARELVVLSQDAYSENSGSHDYTRAVLNARLDRAQRRNTSRARNPPASRNHLTRRSPRARTRRWLLGRDLAWHCLSSVPRSRSALCPGGRHRPVAFQAIACPVRLHHASGKARG